MESEEKNLGKYYIVDHMEGLLLDWCEAEYLQINEFLKSSPSKAFITNAKTFTDKEETDLKTLEKNKTCTKELENTLGKENVKVTLIQEPYKEFFIRDNDKTYLKIDNKNISIERLCLLDMKATEALSPKDAQEFDVFLFGGILGDHPSKDRTSSLRVEGFKSRHLGEMQMTTDTAVLCTKLVVENGLKLNEIPYVDEPEFFKSDDNKQESVCMEGFRYITDEIDYETGKISITQKDKSKVKVLGNKQIYENLIFEEFDFTAI
jgi:ribosome biogenesis SPOUT family RNA methylase Rps3